MEKDHEQDQRHFEVRSRQARKSRACG